MTEASVAMPNPVELFEKTTNETKKIVSGVRQEQLGDSTPCTEWNVKAVLNHLIGGAELTFSGLTGTPFTIGVGKAESSYMDETDASKLSQAYEIEVGKVLQAAAEPGALERKVPTPFGEMGMAEFLLGTTMDNLIHGWDLAKATAQEATINPELVEMSYNILVPDFADLGRQGGLIGPVVEVPEDASLQDKMLAYMGRNP